MPSDCLRIDTCVMRCFVRSGTKIEVQADVVRRATAGGKPCEEEEEEELQRETRMVEEKMTLIQQRGELEKQLRTGVWGLIDTRPVQVCQGLCTALCAQLAQLPYT